MGFKLFRDKSNQIVRDAIASSFGFGTKKERMDRQIDSYRVTDKNKAEYSMAKRNILLGNVKAIIDSYDKYKKVYQDFLDNFDKLQKEVEDLVYKRDSLIEFELRKTDGTFFAKANYSILMEVLKSKNLSPDEVVFFVNDLQRNLPKTMNFYAMALIRFNGVFDFGGKEPIVNYEVCEYYRKLRYLLDEEYVVDLSGLQFIFDSSLGSNEILQAREFVQKNNSSLIIILNRLDMEKDKLEH